jgi:hypothetical protein
MFFVITITPNIVHIHRAKIMEVKCTFLAKNDKKKAQGQYGPWTYYRMDTGFQNGAHSFLCELLNGAGQHQGEICFRIIGA